MKEGVVANYVSPAQGRSFDTPLCVDLDGTLVKTDTLIESGITLLRKRLLLLFAYPIWLLRGKARLKHEIASRVQFDAASLPYHEELLAFLESEKARGRRLVLATASARPIAESVAEHLKLFDAVLTSDEHRNLKGSEKARALAAEFGAANFSYAGNGRADLDVWKVSRSAITVGTPKSVAARIPPDVPVERQFVRRGSWLKSIIKAMRPYQWVKNLLVFVPIITAGAFFEIQAWRKALLMFIAFSLTASGAYLMNGVIDVTADRQHPRKRKRPFASGDLSLTTGLLLTPLLLGAGLAFGLAAGGALYILVYAAMTFLYSLTLKHYPLIDLFALSSLYSVRLFAGGEVSSHEVSFWLLGFSSFLFLSLAGVKRVAELRSTKKASRGYEAGDRDLLQIIGVGSSLVSANLLALYVQSDTVAKHYANPRILWATVPLLLLWQCRLWLSTTREYMLDDPIVYAAKDWVSWLIGLALALVLAAGMVRF